MRKRKVDAPVLILMFLILAAASGCGEGPLPGTGRMYSERIHSDVTGDEYVLRFRLPPGYETSSDTLFQVLFQLDATAMGLEEMDYTVGFVSELEQEGRIPPTVVVGIDYAGANHRFRDFDMPDELTPAFRGNNSDLFYLALKDEIVPYVHEKVRVDPASRALIGHSMGGLFALYAGFRYDPESPLFTRIIANDPSYMEDVFVCERWMSERLGDADMRVFLSMALWNGPVQKMTHDWMYERLVGRNYPSMKVAKQEYETDHGGVIGPGTRDGLIFVLGGDL